MSEPTITLVVSDLHVGGGAADPGDDHVYQGGELVRFLRTVRELPENAGQRLELFFNGDFLEFAQTNQQAFSHVSDDYWCSEGESLAKLETILAGHADIFDELGRFIDAGHAVTIAAGNHDVDLYWPAVQLRLRERVRPALAFELGSRWVARHGGRLQIAHGHMEDPANRFKHWDNPIRTMDYGFQRLEMCPGTLFMLKFVNKMEAEYPFADNLLPVTKLASVLLRDDKSGLASVGWALATFVGGSPLAALHAGKGDPFGAALLDKARHDAAFRANVESALRECGRTASLERWRAGEPDDEVLAAVMFDLLGRIDEPRWRSLFTPPPTALTLGSGRDATLSAVARAAFEDGSEKLRQVAQARRDATLASVVVMGHTHQPDDHKLDGGHYFNPGCWTRYLQAEDGEKITLEQLRDERWFPYQLNYVRVQALAGGGLDARMVMFDEQERTGG